MNNKVFLLAERARAGLVWFAASALKCCRLNIVTDKIITNPQVECLCQQDLASVKSLTMKLKLAQNTSIIAK